MICASLVSGRNQFSARFILAFTALRFLLAVHVTVAAEKVSFEDLQSQAKSAYASGKREEAIKLMTQAIAAEPENPRAYFLRARFHADNREPARAIADFDQVIKFDPRLPDAWQHRGSEHFKLGHIKESLADFDKFIALAPEQAPHHWQRGICLYYAEQFAEGRKQFELHQTVNPNDVENAVWHFLCVARESGVEKARAALIPIKGDVRVPMKEIHALFAGQATAEDVLKAARADGSTPAQRKRQLFYANLYLGLYFEATSDAAKSREHIQKAVTDYGGDDYMGDVARVHWQLRARKHAAPTKQN